MDLVRKIANEIVRNGELTKIAETIVTGMRKHSVNKGTFTTILRPEDFANKEIWNGMLDDFGLGKFEGEAGEFKTEVKEISIKANLVNYVLEDDEGNEKSYGV